MQKRGQGEGGISQRKDGRWQGTVTIQLDTGQRRRVYHYGNTKKEVMDWVNQTLRDQQRGLPLAPERQTLGEFLDRWLRDVVKPNLRPATYVGYEVLVRVHIKPVLGKVRLTKLSPQQVQALMTQMRASGISERTIQYMRAVLRRALNQAMKWDLVARNAAALTDPPRVRREEIQPWTLEQARTFVQSLDGNRLIALYALELTLGLRRGEVLGLAWEDVDLEKRTLTVRRSLQRVSGQLQFGEPKTAKSHRTLALPRELIPLLQNHRLQQDNARRAAGGAWPNSGLVFTSTKGTPLEPRNINRAFARAIEKAGLPQIRFHDLRHTAISQLIAGGIPLVTAQKIAGHSRVSTTADVYTHVVQAQFDEAADRIGAQLWSLDKDSEE